jgi:DNA-binding SARP family transcriptional activator
MVRLTMERRRGGTTRDQLADTLWPEGLPNTWASALRGVVSRVRAFVASALPPGCLPPGSTPIVAEAGRYVLHLPDDTVVDLERAEAAIVEAKEALAEGRFADARRLAATAATCLRTPFLPDHDGEWVAGMRNRLGDLLFTGLETASLAASALGDHGDALGFANEAIRRAPLRESAHRCRMTAHVTAGNRAEALRTYQQLRRTLAEELGVDPAPETEAAYLELLGTPSSCPGSVSSVLGVPGGPGGPLGLDAGSAAGGGAAVALGSGLGPGSPVPFVGRQAPLAGLADAWTRAAGGDGHMILVTGEPGVGKTRLVTEAAHRVAVAGGLVLGGRCDRGAVGPCQPFVEAIGGYLAATPDDALPDLPPALRDQLAAAPFGAAAPPPGPGSAGPGSAGGAELSGALAEVLVLIARDRPVLLVVDDIHLADPDTLVLLRRVSRQCTGTSLLVLATAGDEVRASGPFAEVVHDLERDGWLHRLPVPGLDEADVRALARHILAEGPGEGRPAPHRLLGDSGGNPFLLVQLLLTLRHDARPRAVSGRISPAIDEYAAARLGALGDPARDLVRSATVFGGTFELDLAAHAAGLPQARALDAVDTLLATGLVAEVGDGPPSRPWAHRYRFAQDVVRRALYDQLSDARRRTLHAGAADAIERLDRDALAHYTLTLAHHRAAGAERSGDQRAARSGLVAAARASRGRAPNEAVRLYRQALDHMPAGDDALRAEALTDLGLAQKAAGQPGSEQSLLDGAIQARRCGRLDVAARAALGLADVVAERPAMRSEAVALVDEVLSPAAAGSGGDGAIDDLTLARLVARQAHLRGRVAAAPAVTATALEALARELHLAVGPDQVERRLALAADLDTVSAGSGDSHWRVLAAHHRAMAAELRGDVATRDQALEALADATGDGGLLGDALLADHAVARHTTEGRFADAAAAAELAAVLSGDASHGILPVPGAMAARQMLVAWWMRGPGRLPPRDPAAGTPLTFPTRTRHSGFPGPGRGSAGPAAPGSGFADPTAGAAAGTGLAAGLGPAATDSGFAGPGLGATVAGSGFPGPAAGAAGGVGGFGADGPGAGTTERAGEPGLGCAAEWPGVPADPYDLTEQALVAIAAGDRGRAHLVVRSLATGVEPLPPGDVWPHAAGLLGLAAAELGDPTTADAVRELLTPYADLTCGAGYRSFAGPMSLHLGRLAAVVGDWAEAERHFTSALRQLAARRARPWIALTHLALARALHARGRPGDRRWAAALRTDARVIVTELGLLPRWVMRIGTPAPSSHPT